MIGLFRRKIKNACRFLDDHRWRKIFALYLVTFGVLVPVLCQRLRNTPLEPMFTRNQTTEKLKLLEENKARYNASVEILHNLSQLKTYDQMFPKGHGLNLNTTASAGNMKPSTLSSTKYSQVVEKSPLDGGIAISVITVSRTTTISKEVYEPYYLTQTVATFLDMFSKNGAFTNRVPIHFSVCNVDLRPEKNREITSLPKWLPVYQRYNHSTINTTKPLKYDKLLDKEKDDYVFCLDRLLEQNMSYVILIEDDALPRDNILPVLERLMISRRQLHTNGVKTNLFKDVLFVKMYHPERLVGFISFEIERISELLAIAVIFTVAACILNIHCFYTENKRNASTLQVISLFIYFILLTVSIGRYNICELRRVSNSLFYMTPAPSCCTPAMLFPRKGAMTASNYLKSVTCKKGFGKDSALDKLVKEQQLETRLVQPNLFKHIGHFSSLRKDFLNPFIV